MWLKTFPGGVHPPTFKDLSRNIPIKTLPPPKRVVLPLSQHTGAPATPTVAIGDKVKEGQKIATSDKFISSALHAPISGTISKIEAFNHPLLGRFPAIFIEAEGNPSLERNTRIKNPIELPPEKLKEIIREAGIVGLGGAAFPTHVKLSPPKDKAIDTVILNGAECEPYLTSDERLMIENPKEILKALELILKIVGAEFSFIGIEVNKPQALREIKKARDELNMHKVEIVSLEVKYPQGAEKQLIKTILNREVPSGGLPFDVGVLVQNVGTAFAIYEALYQGKPLYERIITVSGKAIKNPGNFRVRIGTLLQDIVEFCGGLVKEPKKVIFGGPMMGWTQFSLNLPIIKGTSGILFLTEKELNLEKGGVCIRCGKCIEVCPMKIMPSQIALAAEKQRWEIAKIYSPLDCIECGACSYICPTRRDLVHLIKLAKLRCSK